MYVYLVIKFDGIDYIDTKVFSNEVNALEWIKKQEKERNIKYELEKHQINEYSQIPQKYRHPSLNDGFMLC